MQKGLSYNNDSKRLAFFMALYLPNRINIIQSYYVSLYLLKIMPPVISNDYILYNTFVYVELLKRVNLKLML